MDCPAILDSVLDCLPTHAVVRRATLSAARGRGGGYPGEDHISALPDDLLASILSRLPVKEAVRTTALSRRWRLIWRSAPLFLYDAHLLPSRGSARVAAIDRVLTGHPGPIRAVHLANCFFDLHLDKLDESPRLLAAGGVQDLVFVRLPPRRDLVWGLSPVLDPLLLPDDILRCAKLRRLYLGYWAFPNTADLPDDTCIFPDLRELGILETTMEDRDLDHIMASSPRLETLALVRRSPQHVRLRGQNLRCVLFWMYEGEEIAVVDAPLLRRLVMWCDHAYFHPGYSFVRDKIACSPDLKVLGFLEPGVHELQIGDTFIMANTRANPSSVVPSVKILALRLNLTASMKTWMLPSFLRCFPNIETLHVEYFVRNELSGKHDAEFFEMPSPIECVQSQIKKVVLHKFQGHEIEIAFLKYLSKTANKMQELMLVLPNGILDSGGKIKGLLTDLVIPPWASEACTVLLLGPEADCGWKFHRASDLSISDPFLPEDRQELFRFIKE